ncbi:MAG: rhomboid family intramembrane serine protease [Planctomycetota bacterium]
MALHNRDYMGGAAPSPWDKPPPPGPRDWLRPHRLLVLLCVLVFLLYQVGALGPTLLRLGLVTRDGLAQGRVWTLLFASFFHVDLLHLALSCLFVWWFGREIEREHGGGLVVALFLLGGVATGLGAAATYPGDLSPAVGGGPTGLSSGTGFYVGERLMVTNAHVVDDAAEVVVEVGPEGSRTRGVVRARDAQLDLALVEVGVPGEPLALSEAVVPGRTVFALGYGVVSGENADLLVTKGTIAAHRPAKQRILTDATVNPGNSGGPLVDADGRWVGVVVAKSRSGEGVDSIGYAVDGQAVAAWLAQQGCQVRRAQGDPQGSAPPAATQRSVGRILVGAGPVELQPQQRRWIEWDPRVFGASGGMWALALFCLFRWPRREVSIAGQGVPLLVLFLFYGCADVMGALRVHAGGMGFSHAYHLAGGAVGFLAHRLRAEQLARRIARALKARRAPALRVLPPLPPGPEAKEGAGSDKLDPAARKRMDEVLEKISRAGIGALTAEERAFLEEASGKLRGDG